MSAYSAFGRLNGVGPTLDRQKRRMDSSSDEPFFTNCTRDFLGTLDYIFYTADSLGVESLLELLDEESLRKDTALPSPEWSSDHIALLAEFRCNLHPFTSTHLSFPLHLSLVCMWYPFHFDMLLLLSSL
jgi:CCR4-NOT transcription complex subunit 6